MVNPPQAPGGRERSLPLADIPVLGLCRCVRVDKRCEVVSILRPQRQGAGRDDHVG